MATSKRKFTVRAFEKKIDVAAKEVLRKKKKNSEQAITADILQFAAEKAGLPPFDLPRDPIAAVVVARANIIVDEERGGYRPTKALTEQDDRLCQIAFERWKSKPAENKIAA